MNRTEPPSHGSLETVPVTDVTRVEDVRGDTHLVITYEEPIGSKRRFAVEPGSDVHESLQLFSGTDEIEGGDIPVMFVSDDRRDMWTPILFTNLWTTRAITFPAYHYFIDDKGFALSLISLLVGYSLAGVLIVALPFLGVDWQMTATVAFAVTMVTLVWIAAVAYRYGLVRVDNVKTVEADATWSPDIEDVPFQSGVGIEQPSVLNRLFDPFVKQTVPARERSVETATVTDST